MKNKIYLKPLLITVVLFLLFRLPYRSYIYTNHIYDFYIADTAPNFFAVFLFVFLKKWQNTDSKLFKNNYTLNIVLIIASFLSMVFYELFIQKYFTNAIIDIKDIYASLFASVVAFVVIQKMDN